MFTRIRVALVATCALIGAATPAVAHHGKAPLPDRTTTLRAAYLKLYSTVEKTRDASPGRNVVLHGRPKDGKADHALVREEAARLWTILHPGVTKEHRVRAELAQRTAPAWWVAMSAPVRACESGGNYSTNTGNGFYGAWQFNLQTWYGMGGTGNPAHASPREQNYRAYLLWKVRGWQPWPVCGQRA